MRTRRAGPLLERKIKSLAALKKIIANQKRLGKRIVFTNGCFDLLHYGHVKYLQDAKAKGDLLVVAVNSDASVKKIKGRNRPIINQSDRLKTIAGLASVDYVVLFSASTPLKLITEIKPDVLIKGADWNRESIVGATFVEAGGGKVYTIKLEQGRSTTKLIRKIVKNFRR